jgi:hypothetical protein
VCREGWITAAHLYFVGDHESRVEANAELADDVADCGCFVLLLLQFLQELERACAMVNIDK